MSTLFEEGIRHRVIGYDVDENTVVYTGCHTRRSLSNPEEKVQAEAYVVLTHKLGYPSSHIRICQSVKMGSSRREADIVVYSDQQCKHPEIIVECKKKGISEAAFQEAIEQGFSYASATGSKFLWVTSGEKNAFFEYWHHSPGERMANQIPALPAFQQADSKSYQLRVKGWRLRQQLSTSFGSNNTVLVAAFVFQFLLFLPATFLFFWQYVKAGKPAWMLPWEERAFLPGFLVVGAAALISSALLTNAVQWLRKKASVKKRSLIFLFWPMAALAFLFPASWWNMVHYERMAFREWMFFQPFIWVLLLQLVSLAFYSFFTKK